MQEAKVQALEAENAQLREALLKAQSMIERLQKRLKAAGVATDAVDLASCVTVESVVRNTLGSVLFRVFVDPPETKEELFSWFAPYLAHLPRDALQLLIGSSEAPCAIEDAQDIDQLQAVTAVVRIDNRGSQWRILPSVRTMALLDEPHCSLHRDDDARAPAAREASVGVGGDPQPASASCPLFTTANVLVAISAFVSQSVLVALSHVSRHARRVLFFDHATATALARPLGAGPQWSLANNVFVLRPVVAGYAMHHAQESLNGTRPLRLLHDVVHRVAASDTLQECSTVPSQERLEAALTLEQFASTMHQDFLFLGGVRRAIVADPIDPNPGDGDVSAPSSGSSNVRPACIVPGAMLDVLDTVQKWYDATVLEVDTPNNKCLVHYEKWANQWDEWIDYGSQGYRLQPLGARFDSAKDPLKSDFRFFQVMRYVAAGGGSMPQEEADVAVADATAASANRTAILNSMDDVRQTAMRLDAEWASVLIPSVFAANSDLLRCIDGAKMISRVAKPRDMVAMVETSYVSRDALVRFMMGYTRGPSIQSHIDPSTVSNDVIDCTLRDVPMILRLVELYTEETVNAFFVVVNRFGEGLVYTRFGARHWKHT